MTVAELITWLATQDQGAIVQVLVRENGRAYEGDVVYTVTFTPELAEYMDLRGNQHIQPNAPYFNERYLLLGER